MVQFRTTLSSTVCKIRPKSSSTAHDWVRPGHAQRMCMHPCNCAGVLQDVCTMLCRSTVHMYHARHMACSSPKLEQLTIAIRRADQVLNVNRTSWDSGNNAAAIPSRSTSFGQPTCTSPLEPSMMKSAASCNACQVQCLAMARAR